MTTEELKILCDDLAELTETNCHGEALEKIADWMNDKRMQKGFAAVNCLHDTFGYLDSPIAEIRHKLSKAMFARIEAKHGASVATQIYNSL